MPLFIGMVVVGVIWFIYMLLQDRSIRFFIAVKYEALIKPKPPIAVTVSNPIQSDITSASLLGKAKSVSMSFQQSQNVEENEEQPVSSPTPAPPVDLPPTNELVDDDEPSIGYSTSSQSSSSATDEDSDKTHLTQESDGVQYGGLQQQVGEDNGEETAEIDDFEPDIEESLVPADVLDGEAQVYETYDLQEEASFAPGVPLDDYWKNLTTVQTSLDNIGRSALRRASKQAVADRCILFLEIAENYKLVNDANVVAAVEKKADEFNGTEYANVFFAVVQAATEGADNFDVAQMGLEAMAD